MINFKEINERTIPHIEAILSQLKIETRLTGKELQFINPLRNDSDFGSASINVESGMWADFAEADDQKAKGGDLISLVAYLTGTSQSLAAEKLQSFLSEPTHQAVEVIEPVNTQTHKVIDGVKYERVYPVPDGAPFLPGYFGDALGEP
jgi:putative DNA primase/helicase